MQNVLSLKFIQKSYIIFYILVFFGKTIELSYLDESIKKLGKTIQLSYRVWYVPTRISGRQFTCLTGFSFYTSFASLGKTVSNCLTETHLPYAYISLSQTIDQDNFVCLARSFIFYTEYIHTRSSLHTRDFCSVFKFVPQKLAVIVFQALVACWVSIISSFYTDPLPDFCEKSTRLVVFMLVVWPGTEFVLRLGCCCEDRWLKLVPIVWFRILGFVDLFGFGVIWRSWVIFGL